MAGGRQLPMFGRLPIQMVPGYVAPEPKIITIEDVEIIISQLPVLTAAQRRRIERAVANRARTTPGVKANWTCAEERELARLWAIGWQGAQIAVALDRSEWSVRKKVVKMQKQGRLIVRPRRFW